MPLRLIITNLDAININNYSSIIELVFQLLMGILICINIFIILSKFAHTSICLAVLRKATVKPLNESPK